MQALWFRRDHQNASTFLASHGFIRLNSALQSSLLRIAQNLRQFLMSGGNVGSHARDKD